MWIKFTRSLILCDLAENVCCKIFGIMTLIILHVMLAAPYKLADLIAKLFTTSCDWFNSQKICIFGVIMSLLCTATTGTH